MKSKRPVRRETARKWRCNGKLFFRSLHWMWTSRISFRFSHNFPVPTDCYFVVVPCTETRAWLLCEQIKSYSMMFFWTRVSQPIWCTAWIVFLDRAVETSGLINSCTCRHERTPSPKSGPDPPSSRPPLTPRHATIMWCGVRVAFTLSQRTTWIVRSSRIKILRTDLGSPESLHFLLCQHDFTSLCWNAAPLCCTSSRGIRFHHSSENITAKWPHTKKGEKQPE